MDKSIIFISTILLVILLFIIVNRFCLLINKIRDSRKSIYEKSVDKFKINYE